MEEMDNLKIYILTPEEVESLLMDRYGDRIAPINGTLLERQRQKHRGKQASLRTCKPKACDFAG